MANRNNKNKPSLKPEYPSWLNYALLSGILLVTFWCYHYSLSNQFITSWDDGICCDNPYIKNLSSQNLKMILFKNITPPNYHPVTMLSIALNWHFSGVNPQPFYATEITLHLLNTILVFFLSLALFNAMVKKGYGKIKYIPFLAGLCALWHGIHPMHVESVSWAAERKDVLYLFFYLAGLIVYVKYIMENKRELLILVAFLYFLSLFSKSLAVVFPLSLFTIDILLKRKLEWKLVFEKIPFFIISLIFGCIAFTLQKEGGYIISSQVFSVSRRIMFAGHNYLMYLVKLFVPFPLSSYYPYPVLTNSNNSLPFYFYFAPFAAIGITAGLLYIAFKKGENYFRVSLFGFGFYFFNVMFVLQLVGAGPTIMADRYSYASYVGFTFMLVYFIQLSVVSHQSSVIRYALYTALAAFTIMLGYLCRQRTEVWHDTETLWSDVIKQYPHRVLKAYINLGDYYIIHDDFDKAYDNFIEAINLKTTNPRVYCNMGIIMSTKKEYQSSLDYFTTALRIDSNDAVTYLDRAINYFSMGRDDLAINDYIRSLNLKPTSKCMFFLSKAYYRIHDFTNAYKYAKMAQNAGYELPEGYLNVLH